ncbi:hypothetical protein [Roseomonas indoligenes]|uniref:Uncharacterized protein n=1 Tax=Roseomonas indoligenes TaxID=2820811 RepID=A0A940MY82_9PROT|nr:hypothetical protein [Pararoseomonas indoligenes]MBP0493029.1 hypothetical protein [Pararoseomonas indoligenes]
MEPPEDRPPRIVHFAVTPGLPDGIQELVIQIETAAGRLTLVAFYDGVETSVFIQNPIKGD